MLYTLSRWSRWCEKKHRAPVSAITTGMNYPGILAAILHRGKSCMSSRWHWQTPAVKGPASRVFKIRVRVEVQPPTHFARKIPRWPHERQNQDRENWSCRDWGTRKFLNEKYGQRRANELINMTCLKWAAPGKVLARLLDNEKSKIQLNTTTNNSHD